MAQREGFVTAIAIATVVASQRWVPVVAVAGVADRRADGNGYEDEEPREAAYRRRFRHPRDDDAGSTPRPKAFITVAGRLIVIFGAAWRALRRSLRPIRSPPEGRHVTIDSGGLVCLITMLSLFPRLLRNHSQVHVEAPRSSPDIIVEAYPA